MKKILFLALVLIFVVFRSWFIFQPLSSGDWSFNFSEALNNFTVFPTVWNTHFIGGMGGSIAFILPLEAYFLSTAHILNSIFRLPWVLIERVIWFWPFLIVSFFSSAYLFRKMFPQNNFWIFSALIFLFNSYALILVGGGQMGVAIGYALAPLVLYVFVNNLDLRLKTYDLRDNGLILRKNIIAGLVLALQVTFDARIAYATMVAVGIYFIIYLLTGLRVNGLKERIVQVLSGFTIPVLIATLLHFFWLLPLLLYRQNPFELMGSAYNSSAAVKFFSFADYSHALSLLHPNWPENIFGKTYFLQPEFLLLPVLAFSSLLFIKKQKSPQDITLERSQVLTWRSDRVSNKGILSSGFAGLQDDNKKKGGLQDDKKNGAGRNDSGVPSVPRMTGLNIIFFALLGIFGAFLAKGANEPFGGIYIWLFEHVPGFVMFRDPTKWYVLIALSYSVLIPFSVGKIWTWLNNKSKVKSQKSKIKDKLNKLLPNTFLLLVTCYLLFLIRPAIFGQLGGTFKPSVVPSEYVTLKDYFYNQKDFFRTLWVPNVQRFGFYSNNHPAVDSFGYFKVNSVDEVISKLKENDTQQLLVDSAVKYVIVPFDSKGEMFLSERKYDESKYKKTINDVAKILWLKKVGGFGKIAVFEVPGPKGHFWIYGFTGSRVNELMINPTKYIVQVENAKKGELLVFSEGYDGGWVAKFIKSKVSKVYKVESVKYNGLLNSFELPEDGNYSLEIYYEPQIWVSRGLVVSVATLILCILFLLYRVVYVKVFIDSENNM